MNQTHAPELRTWAKAAPTSSLVLALLFLEGFFLEEFLFANQMSLEISHAGATGAMSLFLFIIGAHLFLLVKNKTVFRTLVVLFIVISLYVAFYYVPTKSTPLVLLLLAAFGIGIYTSFKKRCWFIQS